MSSNVDLAARITRRCNRAVGKVLATVDGLGLPAAQQNAIRRSVMDAIHGVGADVQQLTHGLLDDDVLVGDDWLDAIGFPDSQAAERRAEPIRRDLTGARDDRGHG